MSNICFEVSTPAAQAEEEAGGAAPASAPAEDDWVSADRVSGGQPPAPYAAYIPVPNLNARYQILTEPLILLLLLFHLSQPQMAPKPSTSWWPPSTLLTRG